MSIKRVVAVFVAVVIMVGFLPGEGFLTPADDSACTVFAAKKPAISKKSLRLGVGETYKLRMKNCKEKVKWSSSSKKIATVNQKGVVTGKDQGEVIITATVGKKKYKCEIEIEEVFILPRGLYVGETCKWEVTGGAKNLTWTSSDTSKATVKKLKGNNAAVNGVSEGPVTITVSYGNKVISQEYCVVDRGLVIYWENILGEVMEIFSADLCIEDLEDAFDPTGKQLLAMVHEKPVDGVEWRSEDPSVATVDESGFISAVSEGFTYVTATYDGKTRFIAVSVYRDGKAWDDGMIYKGIYSYIISSGEVEFIDSSLAHYYVDDSYYFDGKKIDLNEVVWTSRDESVFEVAGVEMNGSARISMLPKKEGLGWLVGTYRGESFLVPVVFEGENYHQ